MDSIDRSICILRRWIRLRGPFEGQMEKSQKNLKTEKIVVYVFGVAMSEYEVDLTLKGQLAVIWRLLQAHIKVILRSQRKRSTEKSETMYI